MTETIEQIELNKLFDFSMECGWQAGCNQDADVLAITKCCGTDFPLCYSHLGQVQQYFKNCLAAGHNIECGYCDNGVYMKSMDEWLIISQI